jgi:TRAP-type C4-dicarboxylate transport system substrate-binding protein
MSYSGINRKLGALRRTVLILATAVALLAGPSSFALAETPLKVATHFRPGSSAVNSLNRLRDEVNKQFGGKLSLQVAPQFAPRNQLFETVQNGTVDIALVPITTIPGTEILSLPYAVSGNEQIRSAFRSESEWGQKKLGRTVFLDSWYYATSYVYSRKKKLVTASDFKEIQILSTSQAGTLFSKWIGANAQIVKSSALFENLDSADAVQISSLNRKALTGREGFLTVTNHLIFANLLLANEQAIKRLSPEQREGLSKIVRDLGHDHDLSVYEYEQRILEGFGKSGGQIITEAVPSLRKQIDPMLFKELDQIKIKEGFNLASAGNGCTSISECKCKSGSSKCRCSKECENNSNCK